MSMLLRKRLNSFIDSETILTMNYHEDIFMGETTRLAARHYYINSGNLCRHISILEKIYDPSFLLEFKDYHMLIIRDALLDDLPAITDIYNEAILETVATFDTEPKTQDEQKTWFMEHGEKNPLLVAEESGSIIGWAALSKWSDRCAYSDAAEISLYVKKDHQGEGIGRKLMQALLDKGQKAGLHTVLARIAEGNEVSVHLHQAMGFQHIGIMKEVGKKFNRLLDVYLMQKLYGDDKE
jgi:L-amino acid N-acyltransferase YncA